MSGGDDGTSQDFLPPGAAMEMLREATGVDVRPEANFPEPKPTGPGVRVRPVPDPIEVPGLQYALVSVVTPEDAHIPGTQKGSTFAFKIRGAFATVEEAQAHAKQLIQLDPAFSIYVMKMYNWGGE
eukprot:tig00000492_g1413.t1